MRITVNNRLPKMAFKWPILALLALTLFVFNACGTDDPAEENEEELISEVHIKFVPKGGGEEIEWTWKIEEGSSAEPMIMTSPLAANSSYDMSIELYGEAHSHDGEEDHSDDDHSTDDHSGDDDHGDDENITEEIRKEGEEHQFFYTVTPSSLGLSFSYLDTDGSGNPIGLLMEVTTTTTGSGELTIVLRHELDKFAAGVATGDITNAGGSTDISITLPVVIN
jgi:hypothetical protein